MRVASVPISGAEGFAIYGAVQMIARAFEEFGSPEAVPAVQARLLAQQMLVTMLLAVPHSFAARLHEPAVPAPDAKVQAALRLVGAEQSGERSILDLAAELASACARSSSGSGASWTPPPMTTCAPPASRVSTRNWHAPTRAAPP